jgi:hypothetical protein
MHTQPQEASDKFFTKEVSLWVLFVYRNLYKIWKSSENFCFDLLLSSLRIAAFFLRVCCSGHDISLI